MGKEKTDLLQGTLDLLVLRTLTAGPMHGFAIAERIEEVSQEALRVEEGSLYPALHRIEYKGWIAAQWGVSENGRRAKFYRITPDGRKQLWREEQKWQRIATAVARILQYA